MARSAWQVTLEAALALGSNMLHLLEQLSDRVLLPQGVSVSVQFFEGKHDVLKLK